MYIYIYIYITKIRQGNYFADRINNTYGSSIAEHFIKTVIVPGPTMLIVYCFKQIPPGLSPESA